MEGSSNCDEESVGMIPNQKTSSSDVDVSSMVSMKEGCESPLSSWDSKPENDISPDIDDGFSWEIDNRSYDELLKKFIEKEEELRVSNLKLEVSEQKVIELEVQVKNSELKVDDVCFWYEQKKLLEEDISKLKIQYLKSENELDDMRGELYLKKGQLENVCRELNLKKDQLDNVSKGLELNELKEISTEEIAILQKELGSKSPMILRLQCHIEEEKKNVAILKRELEALVTTNEDNVNNHHEELRKLISILFDLQAKKRELNDDIASLSYQKNQLTSKLEHCESINEKLKEKVKQYEAEKVKQNKLHSTQLMFLQDEISYLRNKRIDERMNDVEASNKESEEAMIKIDGTNVKIDEVEAEIYSSDDQISYAKNYMNSTNKFHKEGAVDYKCKLSEENKLKLKVEELEKEVTEQNGVILNMTEEKKNAIRRLCNSLEHYRSGYTGLIQALDGL